MSKKLNNAPPNKVEKEVNALPFLIVNACCYFGNNGGMFLKSKGRHQGLFCPFEFTSIYCGIPVVTSELLILYDNDDLKVNLKGFIELKAFNWAPNITSDSTNIYVNQIFNIEEVFQLEATVTKSICMMSQQCLAVQHKLVF